MQYIALPNTEKRQLPFYLAMEEYVARHIQTEDCFFMWQVEPTVIFGRNQLIDTEVNTAYCREHGIKLFRRKSGGGCVYADWSNIMFSYITTEEAVAFTYHRYVSMVVGVLQKLGIPASASGRNDVLIEGRKVSGNAFYRIPGRSIVHGTMLYDTDREHMAKAITPADEKLQSKGVNSVRQHIALLKDYTTLSLDAFKDFIRTTLCDNEYMLTEKDVSAIEELMQEYLTDAFIYGHNPGYTVVKKKHLNGVGMFEIQLELKGGIIKNINIMGDFFLIGDLDAGILHLLRGVPLERTALETTLPSHLEDVILHLKKADFIEMLLQEN